MGTGLRNLLCSLTFTICFIHQSNAAAAQQKQQLPSVMVAGSVYCDTCFQQEFTAFSHFIPGASVAVKCNGFQKEVKTNQHGVFKMHLPLEVASRNADTIKSCSVKLVRSSWPFCSVASSATSAGFRLISIRKDVQVFSAGFFTFKPLKQPDVCNQKTKLSASAKYSLAGTGLKRMQSALFLPPSISFLPSTTPKIGGIPLPPNPFQPPSPILPPFPFQPSPPPPFINVPPLPIIPPLPNIPPLSSLMTIPVLPSPPNINGIPLPPNPFQPPPSILPPLPFQPSPPPFLNIPPLPNISPLPTLAPPPPPPPASIFPPLPFPPIFPGNPPAFPSPKLIKSYSLAT